MGSTLVHTVINQLQLPQLSMMLIQCVLIELFFNLPKSNVMLINPERAIVNLFQPQPSVV